MHSSMKEDDHRKEVKMRIWKRIISKIRKAIPGIYIGAFFVAELTWAIKAPLPDPDTYEPQRFQAENGLWYTHDEYNQMMREKEEYEQQEIEEAEELTRQIREAQERYQAKQEAEWKEYMNSTERVMR